jgi:hypothetical protein
LYESKGDLYTLTETKLTVQIENQIKKFSGQVAQFPVEDPAIYFDRTHSLNRDYFFESQTEHILAAHIYSSQPDGGFLIFIPLRKINEIGLYFLKIII